MSESTYEAAAEHLRTRWGVEVEPFKEKFPGDRSNGHLAVRVPGVSTPFDLHIRNGAILRTGGLQVKNGVVGPRTQLDPLDAKHLDQWMARGLTRHITWALRLQEALCREQEACESTLRRGFG